MFRPRNLLRRRKPRGITDFAVPLLAASDLKTRATSPISVATGASRRDAIRVVLRARPKCGAPSQVRPRFPTGRVPRGTCFWAGMTSWCARKQKSRSAPGLSPRTALTDCCMKPERTSESPSPRKRAVASRANREESSLFKGRISTRPLLCTYRVREVQARKQAYQWRLLLSPSSPWLFSPRARPR